jgi:hypothetical protein
MKQLFVKKWKYFYRKSRLDVYIILTELTINFPVAEVYSMFRGNRSNYKKIKRVVYSLRVLLSNLKQTNLNI